MLNVFGCQSPVAHRFMLMSSTDNGFDTPRFFASYPDAFVQMVVELAAEIEIEAEALFEEIEDGYLEDHAGYSVSPTAASYCHHDCEWKIVCLAIDPSVDDMICAIDNWPDADVAPELY